MKLLFIFLLPLSLYSSKILSYNIYDRTDRVDIMITFDTPYAGQIKQSNNLSSISVKLQDSSIESTKLQQISSKFVHSLSIVPMQGFTKIVLAVEPSVKLKASKTSDSYGLRLRFTNKTVLSSTIPDNTVEETQNLPLSNLPTKKANEFSTSYYIVVAILVIGIIILLFVKKRVTPRMFDEERKKIKEKQKSWLFKETTVPPTGVNSGEVSIRFQKNIDAQNSVVMLDFAEQSYLVLMGNNNVLLDKFTEDIPQSQDEFDSILQDKHEKLESFLNGEDSSESKEALQAYTQKASSISYEV
jgi:uncharacterized membrane protein